MNVETMLNELCRAVYGAVWARSSSPEQAWSDLLAKVADLSARSKAGRPEFPFPETVAEMDDYEAERLTYQRMRRGT